MFPSRPAFALVCCLAVLGTVSSTSRASIRFPGGPEILDSVPSMLSGPIGFVPAADIQTVPWPSRVEKALAGDPGLGQGLLLVGRTDPVGPQSLNQALALQLAAVAARRLAAHLGVGLDHFACASVGESETEAPGVSIYLWSMPPRKDGGGFRSAILEPLPGVPNRGVLWAAWQGASRLSLWGHEYDGRQWLWEVPRDSGVLRLPMSAGGSWVGLGTLFSDGTEGLESRQVPLEEPAVRNELRLRLADQEDGWIRLAARVPADLKHPQVWAGGIPYPLVTDARGQATAAVARLGRSCSAHLQAVDAEGQVVVGPPLVFPASGGILPDWTAVLVWSGDGVDLDLHVWREARHTHPLDPDPRYSDTSVPGVRLLFDGDDRQPVSAVVGWGSEAVQVEAHCYSDLGQTGATARLYFVQYPDDPVSRRMRIFGPRTLSERPTQQRWVALPGGEWAVSSVERVEQP